MKVAFFCCELLLCLSIYFRQNVFIGMMSPNQDFEYQWTDGSIMVWSHWLSTEPDYSNQPYGLLTTGYQFGNAPAHNTIGLCEIKGQ